MGIIKILDKNVIDKIAAGEVIERPVSIVKELIENSIDAGASSIDVEIKKGGKTYIGITDNGKGIMADDIGIIFERHATSKISCMEDLYESCSLGFRGEALSSIAAVSKVSLTSKYKDEEVGSRIVISGGTQLLRETVAASQGTSIIVEDLFFNTPVRRKFLKTDTTEAAQISDMIERLALCRADIAFNYKNNAKTQLTTSGFNEVSEVIFQIYGKEVYENLLEVDADLSIGHLSGYIGKPVISRGNRNRQSLFINNRYVKSFMLMKAVQEGYSSFIMQHQFPFFVLKLSLDPATMDVNVHPSKMEVNFENPSIIYKEIYHAIRNRLFKLNTGDVTEIKYEDKPITTDEIKYEDKPLSTDESEDKASFAEIKEEKAVLSDTTKPDNRKYEDMDLTDLSGIQGLMKMGKDNNKPFYSYDNLKELKTVSYDLKAAEEYETYNQIKETEEYEVYNTIKEPAVRIIGQAFKTYIIAEIDDKLYIVDQHAAHEKINFERLIKSLNSDNYAQQLLKPVVLQLTAKEELTITKYMAVFTSLGFEIEHFGGTSYTVRAVPMSFYRMEIDSLFIELLDHLSTVSDVGNIELIKDKIANVACKSSIKAGHIMSVLESEHLIKELLKLNAPFNCPHGRPTMIAMSKYELEKKFKRIV